MKSYLAKKRRNRAVIIAAVLLVIAGGATSYFYFFSGNTTEEVSVLPTDTPQPIIVEATATSISPTPTPYPEGSQWDLTQEYLREWQLKIVLSDLNQFWGVFMAPEGIIDCVSALGIISQNNPDAKKAITEQCAEIKVNGVFATHLALDKLSITDIQLSAEKEMIAVQFDTVNDWPKVVRYYSDNGLKSVTSVAREIYVVYLVFDDGMWRVNGINTFVEGVNF